MKRRTPYKESGSWSWLSTRVPSEIMSALKLQSAILNVPMRTLVANALQASGLPSPSTYPSNETSAPQPSTHADPHNAGADRAPRETAFKADFLPRLIEITAVSAPKTAAYLQVVVRQSEISLSDRSTAWLLEHCSVLGDVPICRALDGADGALAVISVLNDMRNHSRQ